MPEKIEIKKHWGVCEFLRFSVKRFNKLEEAVDYYLKKVDVRERRVTDEEIKMYARVCFPSYFKRK